MTRRFTSLAAIAAAAVLAAGACSSSSGSLDDPVDILVAGMTAAEEADSVHVDVALEGSAPFDLMGGMMSGDSPMGEMMPDSLDPSGGSIDLAGSTISADLDRVDEEGVITFSLPSFLSATGEMRIIGQDAYLKTSLFGDSWYHFDESETDGHDEASPEPSGSPEDPEAELRQALAELSTPPERLADERCGDTDCYHVRIVVEPGDADELASMAPEMSGGTADIWIRKSDELPAQVVLTASGDTDLKVTMTFADWGKDVTVEAPPADQVVDGDTMPFPMDELDLSEDGS